MFKNFIHILFCRYSDVMYILYIDTDTLSYSIWWHYNYHHLSSSSFKTYVAATTSVRSCYEIYRPLREARAEKAQGFQ